MAYIDKIRVNGTDYEIQDSNLKTAIDIDRQIITSGESYEETIVPSFYSGAIHGSSYEHHSASDNTGYSYQQINVGDSYSFNNSVYKVALVGYTTNGSYVNVGGFGATSPVEVTSSTIPFSQTGVVFCCAEFRRIDDANLSSSDYSALNFSLTKRVATKLASKDYVDNSVNYKYFAKNNFGAKIDPYYAWGSITRNSDGSITIGAGEYYFIDYEVDNLNGDLYILLDSASAHDYTISFADTDGSGGSGSVQLNSIGDNKYLLVLKKSDIPKKFIVLRLDNRSSQSSLTINSIRVFDTCFIHDVCYVSHENGNDNYNGTKDAPFKTIQFAIDRGYKKICVAPGEYTEKVTINRKSGISIVPYGIGTYSTQNPSTPMIEISGETISGVPLLIEDSQDIYIEGVWIKNTTSNVAFIRRSSIEMLNCWFSDNDADNGLYLYNVNGVFRDCQAFNIALNSGTSTGDGFNIHGYCDTQFINCVAHDCNDDGISHHEGCTGLIMGGEYYNCGKGGVASPTHGAYVDVCGVYSHDNNYGLYAVVDTARRSKARVYDCVFKNNTSQDMLIIKTDVVAWNNIYDTKSVPTASDLTEF